MQENTETPVVVTKPAMAAKKPRGTYARKTKAEPRNIGGVQLPENSNELADGQDFREARTGRTPKGNVIPNGMSGKCFEIMIYRKEGESQVVFVGPATFGPFWIRRESRVIVPEEVVEALNSANAATIPQSDWDNPREDGSIPLIEVPYIRFPMQVFGPKTWDDYIEFKRSQASKPINPEKRR